MARIINIDEDTCIGYDFIEKRYYIGNKNTETYRYTSTKAKEILDIVAPDNTVTLAQVQELEDNPELLQNVYYTWSDEGDYIHTVQLNTYSKHPLTIDLIAKKLYIMNSELIFDLTLNESAQYRVEYIASYYEKYIGFGDSIDESTGQVIDTLFKAQVGIIYNYLTSFYKPTVYNQISTESISKAKADKTSPLKYSNVFALTNYNSTSPATYTCTLNPNEQYTPTDIANIGVMQADTGKVGLTSHVPSNLYVGQEVLITNSNIQYLDNTFTNNGTYHIAGFDYDQDVIILDQQLKMDYTFPYYEAYLLTQAITISSSSYTNSTITLSATPSSNFYKVNSKMYVKGSTITVDNKQISIDGEYTITSINGTTLTVNPAPPYSIASTSVPNPSGYFVFKRTYLAPVLSYSIENTSVTLMDAGNYITPLTSPFYISFFTEEGNLVLVSQSTSNSVQSEAGTILYLNVIPDMSEYSNFPHLSLNADVHVVQIDTTSTTDDKLFPTGTFNVDTFEQCQQYISNFITKETQIPSITTKNNIGQLLSSSMTLEGLVDKDGNDIPMYSMGVYSMVYTTKK